MPPLPTPGRCGLGHGLIGRLWRPICRLARAAAGRLPALRATWLLTCLFGAAPAWAVHFDVELRTSNGPVAGSRITTEFYGDLGLAGLLPIDAATGYKIFPGYFGDLEGGPLQTDDPGFQAFRGTFLRREEVHFRALGTLQHWDPATGRWGPAAPQVALALFGGIPVEVIIGYTENPAAWQTQYDYHAAGTRFSAAGIQGPLTAVIDDASSTGAFHAHLDWKISASSGEPPVGAYLVTLELWSPTLVNGQPKYLASEPIHMVFERGISEAQMAQAITARVRPPAPLRCAAQTLAWQVDGSGCSADAATTEHGQTVALADTSAPAIGSAAFRCDDGQWRSSGTPSCRPLRACGSQTLGWQVGGQTCSATVSASASGDTSLASDSSAPTLGSARFSCLDGQWSAPVEASCAVPPPRDCPAQIQAWQLAGTSCQAPLAAASAGSSATATDSSGPATGAARYRCDDGSWQLAEVLACALPAPCSADTLQWQVNGQTCSASAAATPSGQALQLVDSGLPTLGQASASCDNGRWSVLAGSSCSVPPPRDCLGQAQTWTVAGTRCEALLPAGTAGSSSVVVDGSGPALGRARYQCQDGSWQLAETPSCAVPRACSPELLRWQVGSQSCEASAPASASGQGVLLSDTTAPTLGSASSRCDDGRWSTPESASCSVPPPADCPAQVQAWQLAGATCQAPLAAAADGSLATATDSSGPATGSARYRCQDGRWLLSELLACAVPRACSAATLAWQVDGHSCGADAAATESGQRQLLSDSGLPTLGAAAFRCDDGRFSVEAGASCAPPPPAACSAQAMGWTVGDASCTASTGAAVSGTTLTLTDASAPSTGSARTRCLDGVWQPLEATSCSQPPRDCSAQQRSWTVAGLACEASLPASVSGQSALAQDSGLPTLGAARFQCSDGQWSAPSADASCAVPDCPATTLAWTGAAGQACQGSVARTVSGAVALAQDLDGTSVGWARAQCQAGQWQAPFSALCGTWQRGSTRAQPRAPWQAPARPPWATP